ncbi:MAG: carbamoyl phosphate synthase small subunit [Clostridia bacterium]|nr:carbamoyl phosphate synthase small subunit [Clostridia bacterium]
MSRTAYLILENGTVFEGKAFGTEKETTGELVFTTAMTGYLETLTDPSYYGQVVIQTFPLIGNYGVIPSDFESDSPSLKGYIVREWCQAPSNFRCEGDLDTFLKDCKIPGIYGIDTRALTRIVREYGVLNCKIAYSNDISDKDLAEIKNYKIRSAVESTTTDKKQEFKAENGELNVVLMDFGAKHNIGRELVKRGCNVTVVPANTTADEIKAMNPDGIMLSNGPGDPSDNTEIIAQLKKLCEYKIPTFGICLGHQLLALSQGAKTEKLKYGHRGANQPAKELETGRVYITSQNHGYAVVSDSMPSNGKVSFVNGNDNTCEGVTYTDMPAFSVQFHPEACGGPHDTAFLFDRFIKLIKDNK